MSDNFSLIIKNGSCFINGAFQKIDLAIAYLNMGSTRKAKSLLGKLKQLKISKKQLQQIDGVLADIKK